MKRGAAIADYVWTQDAIGARAARTMLAPWSWLFGAAVARRNARYDARRPVSAALPALSVGNLTVGGTGKTPLAAWFVRQLRERGAHPAIVMRGVGDDEWRVHGILNPGISVVVSVDRHAGMLTARTRGADCAVLDDAFQHRRAHRLADVVVLSADQWTGNARLLPAGPFREPLTALQRADVAVITVKAASAAQVDDLVAVVRAAAPAVPVAVVRLTIGRLSLAVALGRSRTDSHADLLTHPPSWLAEREISVVTAIGDPAAFEDQLRAAGAILRSVTRFGDHHAFTIADAARIAAEATGLSGVVCTLKDAVKLATCWPREAPPLWYLSQSVVVERGAEAMEQVMARLLAARTASTPTAG